MMSNMNSVVAVFDSHEQAENAIRELQEDGFDVKQLSIVGKDCQTEEHAVGYYTAGDRTAYWGNMGAFWGGLWGLMLPGIGPLLVAGPLVMGIAGSLEGTSLVGGLSALGAALFNIGIPKNSVVQYETEVRNGKLVLVVHGTANEVERAKDLLHGTQANATTVHAEEATVGV
jgi:uncharacterized membrane protein